MARKTSRQHLGTDVYEDAEAAWARAEYGRVHELLAGDTTARGRVLIARAHLRLFDYAAVRSALATVTVGSPEDFAEADVLRAYADDCLAGSSQAFATTALAKLKIPRTASSRVRAMLAFYRAFALFNRKENEAAYGNAEIVAQSSSSFYRASGLNLMAWIEVTQKQYATALSHFEQCIALLGGSVPIDERKRLNAVDAFALIGVNTLNADAIGKLVSGSGMFVSNPRGGRDNLQTQCNVALAHALLGDDVAAFEALIGNLDPHERGPFTALPHIELASLHSRRGGHDAATLHLETARRILDRTDWKNEDDQAWLLLLHYAAEAAFSDRPAASRMFAKAMNSSGRKNLAFLVDEDGLSKALALYARGRIEAAAERTTDAVRDITEARDIWANAGYLYRAQVADTALIALGASGTKALQSRVKRAFPASWLASDAKTAKRRRDSPLNDISEAEMRVVEGICEGLTSKEIAARSGLSPSTIKNQTINIYRTLGVNRRAALVALVMGEK